MYTDIAYIDDIATWVATFIYGPVCAFFSAEHFPYLESSAPAIVEHVKFTQQSNHLNVSIVLSTRWHGCRALVIVAV